MTRISPSPLTRWGVGWVTVHSAYARGGHIPARYLRGSERQRRELLAGLLDSDGYVHADGQIQFAVANRRLAR